MAQNPDNYAVDDGNWQKLNDSLARINERLLEIEHSLDLLHQQIMDILNNA